MTIIRKLAVSATLSAIALTTFPALAQNQTVDFEGANGEKLTTGIYGQATEGAGAADAKPAATFSSSAVAERGGVAFPRFENAPTNATLNFAGGFVDQVSFQYSALAGAQEVVTIYGGLDRSGPVLAEVTLGGNAKVDFCSTATLCQWDHFEVAFAGIAKSIGFGGCCGRVDFDDVVITPVPESETYAMLGLGLAGVAVVVRRRRKTQITS